MSTASECDNCNKTNDSLKSSVETKSKETCCKYNIVILVTTFFIYFFVQFPYTTTGVLYLEYVVHFSTSVTVIGFLPSSYCLGRITAGVVGGGIAHTCGARVVSFIGSIICSFSVFSLWFTTSVPLLIVQYGFIGTGASLLYLAVSSSLQQHFTKCRTLVTAVAMCGLRIADLMIPPLTRYISDRESWRMAVAILSMCILQTGWLSMLLRPACSTKMACEPCDRKKTCARCQKIFMTFGFHLLQNKTFFIFCMATVFLDLNRSTLFIHIVNKAIFIGTSKQTAALMMSVLGITSIVTRIFFGIITTQFDTNKLVCYGFGTLGLGTSIMLMNCASNLGTLATFVGSASCFLSLADVVQQALLVDIVGIDNVFRAMGVLICAGGTGQFCGPPLAAYLFDISDGYDLPFYVAGASGCFAGFLTIIIFPFSNHIRRPSFRGKTRSTKKDSEAQCTAISILAAENQLVMVVNTEHSACCQPQNQSLDDDST